MIRMLGHLTLSQRSLKLSSFILILFYFFLSASFISTILSSISLILSSNALYYHDKCFNETQSHTDAQNDFLFSRPEGEEPIAMMFEGTYWANEARETFEDIGSQYGEEYDAYHRNIGVMAMPKATKDQIGEPHTIGSTSAASLGFINANCNATELALAKLFLQYVNTDKSLREFTVTTNTIKDMEYDLLDSDLAQMTGFGKMLWNTRNSLNRVYAVSKSSIFLNNSGTFVTQGWEAKIGSTTYNRPADQLRGNSADKISAKDYYFGLGNYYTSSWYFLTNFWMRRIVTLMSVIGTMR